MRETVISQGICDSQPLGIFFRQDRPRLSRKAALVRLMLSRVHAKGTDRTVDQISRVDRFYHFLQNSPDMGYTWYWFWFIL